ncbi:hypothetical protein CC85DRAFT_286008 [Cutaneotrichosporon oleaginosum]|uniref:Uncharacterized protein n=1 Tax=Cutaneotrichosporon oleaginosum TaxID=879819 RepID=A0A0J0XLF5_9TREE|nr:uncharacterized protein CC85DRAFT_286008 [Cutaneotrichosporon oleaginosum]KLT41917.1 hypothetical protein CC85DRAFT_286008 [Cutaneotrichosporon oleaginosum]
MEAAVYQLRRFVNEYGDTGKAEIHAAVPKRVLSMDVDEAEKYLYCGPLVKDGVLYIVFRSDRLYVNLDDGLDPIKLTRALSETPAASAATLSPTVKVSIAKNYDPKAEQLRVAVAEAVNVPDLKLVPNFEHNYGAMKAAQAAGVSVRSGWEDALARATADYFAELASQLKRHKIATDDILQEAFVDVVSKREVVLRD